MAASFDICRTLASADFFTTLFGLLFVIQMKNKRDDHEIWLFLSSILMIISIAEILVDFKFGIPGVQFETPWGTQLQKLCVSSIVTAILWFINALFAAYTLGKD